MSLARLHRVLGVALGLFIALHLANHLALFAGPQAHLRFQEIARLIYRFPLVEPLLIAGFALQAVLGLTLLRQRGWPRRGWARLQVGAGLVLMLFLLQHIPAALLTRWLKPELDTNIFWAAAVVSRPGFAAYFAPYYALGLGALFAHGAAFVALRRRKPGLARMILGGGVLFALLFVTRLMGLWGEIPLPPAYEAYLDDYWF